MTLRSLLRFGVVLAAIAAGGSLYYALRVAAIGVAYTAKMLCSGVFVSGRDVERVRADLSVDDLAPLRYVTAQVDRGAGRVDASFLGITRTAAHRGDRGCVLMAESLPLPAADEGGPTPAAAGVLPAAAAPAAPAPRHRAAYGALERVLADAFADPDPERLRRTHAVVVVHRGRVAAERYAPGIDRDTPLIGWSMAKSVVNALAGILVRRGRLSLHDPPAVGEWRGAGDRRRAITLDHLLRMSSGLQFEEDAGSPLSDVTEMLLATGDVGAFVTRKPLEADPGRAWKYSSGTTNVISRIMRDVLRDDREYLVFPSRELFEPIGMEGAVLETDAAGTFIGSSFAYATARGWARFGELYLRDGVWDGTRILPEGWVAYTRTPAPADSERRYGAHFWLTVPEGYRPSGVPLPADAFHAAGHAGQFVTIVPSREAVIVRLGLTRHHDAWDHAAFVRDVLAALPM